MRMVVVYTKESPNQAFLQLMPPDVAEVYRAEVVRLI